ncbi:8386_t:CDS:2 [Funneliformis caledonium]|uniref:8386_t:CDS:1 n=1 Tax=Funneliformis caledonium TaxID=1117310 RepID=A0A9N8V843_9GLOM|nr:8386_t:CDS:2 [Funneliformis caledonium]
MKKICVYQHTMSKIELNRRGLVAAKEELGRKKAKNELTNKLDEEEIQQKEKLRELRKAGRLK